MLNVIFAEMHKNHLDQAYQVVSKTTDFESSES